MPTYSTFALFVCLYECVSDVMITKCSGILYVCAAVNWLIACDVCLCSSSWAKLNLIHQSAWESCAAASYLSFYAVGLYRNIFRQPVCLQKSISFEGKINLFLFDWFSGLHLPPPDFHLCFVFVQLHLTCIQQVITFITLSAKLRLCPTLAAACVRWVHAALGQQKSTYNSMNSHWVAFC